MGVLCLGGITGGGNILKKNYWRRAERDLGPRVVCVPIKGWVHSDKRLLRSINLTRGLLFVYI